MKDIYGREIQFIETKENNLSLCVEGILLHSKYYPEKEASGFAENHNALLKDKNIVLIYGLALGYHIKAILRTVSDRCKVKIFDVDEELLNITVKEEIIKEIKEDSRVEINIGYSEEFLEKLSMEMEKVEDIIIYKPSLRVLPNIFDEFRRKFERYELGKIAVNKFGQKMQENIAANLTISHERIEAYLSKTDFKEKPILIVSAGPSLDYAISDIIKTRDKFVIFAVGSALSTLKANGIKPDMFCIIDPQEIVYKQIENNENLDIPLCFLNTASHLAVSRYNGPKYMFYNEENEDNLVVDTGKSVATALLSLAILAGGNPIVFVGQDLAYLNNRTHCRNYPHESDIIGTSDRNNKVLGVSGEMLDTTPGLLYFKNWIERTIKENPHVEYINCSKGAKINGTKEMEILDVIRRDIK